MARAKPKENVSRIPVFDVACELELLSLKMHSILGVIQAELRPGPEGAQTDGLVAVMCDLEADLENTTRRLFKAVGGQGRQRAAERV